MNKREHSLTKKKLEEFHDGKMLDAYLYFGAYVSGNATSFTVWVPDVRNVSVICTAPDEGREQHVPMEQLPEDPTIWRVEIDRQLSGFTYEYEIETNEGERLRKTDPFARAAEYRPQTRSIVRGAPEHRWSEAALRQKEIQNDNHLEKPMAIYEVHIGTWKRKANGDFLTYKELVDELIPYVKEQGFTHIEIMPITEHPLDESWGYQTTGFFAATSRFGTEDELKYFIDKCAQHGVGLFLDWVPGHFCVDAHALANFNGSLLYEEPRPARRMNPDWGTLNFDVQKGEVISFIFSSAHYWLEEFKFDGVRMDAVVNLLFIPNVRDRPHNDEGADFLRKLTTALRERHPDKLLIAEDAWHFPGVTKDVAEGGLGFHYKWNFGWMNDVQRYMEAPPEKRPSLHEKINFSLMYHYEARYISTLSHDEVSAGKGSLLHKMAGTFEEQLQQLRLLYGFWITHPGKKLLFMGQEFGEPGGWEGRKPLDWEALEQPEFQQMAAFIRELLAFYKTEPALFELDDERRGFQWLDADNAEQSVASFIRRGHNEPDDCIVICNFSNQDYPDFPVGLPASGTYEEVFSTTRLISEGNESRGMNKTHAKKIPMHDQAYSMVIDLPALSMSVWKRQQDGSERN
ncbi:1,4-alpha-glucan branching enzyme [Planococcus lenghuensis]|uniref:1,4-alpha-glucan branching enzyme n=1 Tax=Planococcus lenghuensis TaxID=2213202 RepID=A0A1Q2L505_9BACL|nr:1,4-alpha-glucan branching enzyme [Planococcus lenghuensis]